MSVLLHIGYFRTGTTSLQRWLRDHPAELAAAGCRFPNGWLRRDKHLEPHFAFMRPSRGRKASRARMKGDEWRNHEWRVEVRRQLADYLARHEHETTILSGEHTSLLRHHDELEQLAELVGYDAHVVLYQREPYAWLNSMRNEFADIGVSADPDAFNYFWPDSWLLDHQAVAELWRCYFPRLTVFDYDRCVAEDGSTIPAFCDVIGVQPPTRERLEAYWLNASDEQVGHPLGTRSAGLRFGDELE